MQCLKQRLKLNKQQFLILKDYTKYSKNLYNYTLYIAKNYFEQTGKYIGYFKLEKEIKENENYKLLPAQSAQQIIKLVDQNFRSFFSLLKKKSKGEYDNKINIPKFKPKTSYFNCIFTFQNCRVKNNKIELAVSNFYKKEKGIKKCKWDFKYSINGKVKQILIKPIGNLSHFEIYINYEENKNITNEYKLNKTKYLSIDLGLNNLASCVNSDNGHSFLMNGKPLKSYNQWFNKSVSNIKSELEIKNKKKISKHLIRIYNKRYWWIDNYYNQTVNYIIKYCLQNKIGNIVVGYNKSWKQGINLGKITNRQFNSISHLSLKRKLENKCSKYGISFILTEESYTSKCSFLDNEELCRHENYLGKRIKRGLFQSSSGRLINADINGSLNILRKVKNEVTFSDQFIKGLIFNPEKINANNLFLK